MIDDCDRSVVMPLALGDGTTTVLVKDCIDIAGTPTRQGSRVLAGAADAPGHADAVARLLADSRWRIVGKANMHEFAFGVTGVNGWTGTPPNPHWPDRIPGGSSSGSASAVASGAVDMALGTDTGGSIRMPAACCGILGFKPSFGLVSRDGVHPAESSLDCVGILARSVAMIERAIEALAEDFIADPESGAFRLAVLSPPVTREVAAAVQDALERSGAQRGQAELPGLAAAFDAALVIIGAENWRALGHLVDHPDLGEDVRGRLRLAALQDAGAVAEAEKTRLAFRAEVDRLLDQRDAIALPTLPIVPPTIEEAADAQACVPLTRLVRPFNLSGHPAISLPLRTADGLPAGLQLVGRRGGDARLCAIARTVSERLAARP